MRCLPCQVKSENIHVAFQCQKNIDKYSTVQAKKASENYTWLIERGLSKDTYKHIHTM